MSEASDRSSAAPAALVRLDEVVAAVPAPQLAVAGGRIVAANRPAALLCGRADGAELVGERLSRWLVPPDRAPVQATLADARMGSHEVRLQIEPGPPPVTRRVRLDIGERQPNDVRLVALADLSSHRAGAEDAGRLLPGLAGAAFVERLLFHVAATCQADQVLVGELDPEEVGRIRTLRVYRRGRLAANFTYTLAGSPCEEAIAGAVCVHPAGVARLFPDDRLLSQFGAEGYVGVPLLAADGSVRGLLVALYDEPLDDLDTPVQTLQAFAVRAGAEIERMRFEQRLAESERRYRRLVENSREGLLVQRDMRVVYANPAVARIMGYDSPEEVVAIGDLARFVAPEDMEMVRGRAAARLRGEDVTPEYELDALRRDGRRIRLRISVTPVEWQGEPALQVLMMDVTDRREAEDQLRQAQKLESLGKLTGGIAHDFNNLLAVILGNLELLEADVQETEARNLVEQARQAADRGADLTRRLLAFARRQPSRPQSVDVARLLEETEHLLARTLGENVRCHIACEEHLLALADPGQFQTALLNLAINGRDAMPEGGELRITTRIRAGGELRARFPEAQDSDYVHVAVADTGTGMAPELLERVFEPFFTTKGAGEGTGLGLSMVHGFARQCGGFVDVSSEPGRGTCVDLYLPRASGQPTAAATPARAMPREAGAERANILVVEDEDGVREVTVAMLRGLGYQVFAAADAEEARDLLGRERLDLLLCDVVLPGNQRGPELAAEALDAQPRLAVLFMSGYAESSVFQRFRHRYDFAFLQKPFRLGALQAHIEEVLVRRRSA